MNSKVVTLIMTGIMATSLAMFGCGSDATPSNSTSQSGSSQNTTSSEVVEPVDNMVDKDLSSIDTNDNVTQQTGTVAVTEISADEAMSIALSDAGVTDADVTGLEAKLEYDDGIEKYDVDFKVGTVEHDYDIDLNGAILSHTTDTEIDD